ncbi:MAG TPA: hypothetical protein VJN89_12070 [Candidatus Acidoferrum sp.]|nr:hypothetical protein [Candidatus Acidoferrum sp.]
MTKFVSAAAFGFAVFASISLVAGQQQAPATGACGGQPFCVETNDFVATVTSFRISQVGTSRIINVSVRFQNRTAQPLVLGYVANSGITTDERGNRYIVYGPNGFRGIGLVYGNTFDPRLTLRPGSSGDAQFEMHLQIAPQNAGQSFTVDLTTDEINTTGNPPTLGGEFPLHFEGLANGVSQGAGSLAGAPDGLANAVSNLRSIFGKKKAVQNAAAAANSAANTAAAVNAAANSAPNSTSAQSASSALKTQKHTDKPDEKPGGRSANLSSSSVAPPPGTKIEEKLVAPYQPQAQFYVSPHGAHVAMVGSNGSRATVIYEGQEGPKFDDILIDHEPIIFSPDGSRYAYCGRSGKEWVVMVDGKELARSSESWVGEISGKNCSLGFTRDGKHVFWYTSAAKSMSSGEFFTRFVFDGKPSIPSAENARFGVAFSPDGNHYAHIWNDPAQKRPWTLIVDGKPAGYQGGVPQWSADSKHLFTQLPFNSPQTHKTGVDLLLDGKPIMRAQGLRLFIPPVGNMTVAIVSAPAPSRGVFLVVEGKRVPGSDLEVGTISDIVFSPDGRHYAAKYENINNKYYVLADGKRGQEYQMVDNLQFTADSSEFAYNAMANNRQFLVIGDQESQGYSRGIKPVFAAAGNHVGAVTSDPASGVGYLLGTKGTRVNARGIEELTFSPDGSHFAFVTVDNGSGRHLAVDGVIQPGSNLFPISTKAAGEFAFSRDGAHFAHFALSPNGQDRGIFLDGKLTLTLPQGNPSQLTFTPDGRHLFWAQAYDGGMRIYMDGKVVAQGDRAMTPGSTGWWEMTADGTLLCLLQGDDGIKRVSITPPCE